MKKLFVILFAVLFFVAGCGDKLAQQSEKNIAERNDAAKQEEQQESEGKEVDTQEEQQESEEKEVTTQEEQQESEEKEVTTQEEQQANEEAVLEQEEPQQEEIEDEVRFVQSGDLAIACVKNAYSYHGGGGNLSGWDFVIEYETEYGYDGYIEEDSTIFNVSRDGIVTLWVSSDSEYYYEYAVSPEFDVELVSKTAIEEGVDEEGEEIDDAAEEEYLEINYDEDAMPYAEQVVLMYIEEQGLDVSTENINFEAIPDFNTESSFYGVIYDDATYIINYYVNVNGYVTLLDLNDNVVYEYDFLPNTSKVQ